MRDHPAVPDPLPVLWLCGPAGVGKSTVGWDLFTRLPGAAYVDIDQLGMCYPEIPTDPGRTVLEARILGRVVANVAAAGAGCLIVSGYIDSRRGIHTEHLGGAELSVLRLRCDRPELRRRLKVRARPGEQRDEILREAEALDHGGLPYPVLDTTARTPAEVLAAVRSRWPAHPARQPGFWPEPVPATGDIVWVCGATAAGKSTVGWQVAQASLRAGHTTGFVDLEQIGFVQPWPRQASVNHRLIAANLAAVWEHFTAYGAGRLVVVGTVEQAGEVQLYADALRGATLTLYRLHPSPEQLRGQIRQRGLGGGPGIAGDQLRGQPEVVLDQAHQAAVAQSVALERNGIADVRVDAAGRTPEDLAAEIVKASGW